MTDPDHPASETEAIPSRNRSGEPAWAWVRVALLFAALVLLTKAAGWWGLVIVLGLVVMIVLHEFGHYYMAKRAGMKVTEFFIGFGPRIWSTTRGETEYGLKIIPAGAYVRIIGMSNAEQVEPEDEPRTYRVMPFWQRFGVAVAGSTMHFIQALILIFILLVFFGQSSGSLGLHQSGPVTTQIGSVYAHCPAYQAGIRPDDEVISINGEKLTRQGDLARIVGPLANEDATFVVRRGDETKTLTAHIVPRSAEPGAAGVLGVKYGPKPTAEEKVGVIAAIPETVQVFGQGLWMVIPSLGRAFTPSSLKSYGTQVVNARSDDEATTTVPVAPSTSLARSLPDGVDPSEAAVSTQSCVKAMGGNPVFTSSSSGGTDAAASRFISIVGIFEIGKGSAESSGLVALLVLFAWINIFIGVFNLIPMLPFDGGHVAIAVYEKIQEWRLHLSVRYYADINKLLPVVYAVILVLGLIFVSSLYLDIANPPVVK